MNNNTRGARVPLFELLSLDDLRNLQDPTWLIDGVLPEDALTMLYAPSGVGKTFVALDIALHIASGRDWCGKKTRGGRILYVCAESLAGLKGRTLAWEHERNVKVSSNRVQILGNSVRLHSAEEVTALIRTVNNAEFDQPLSLAVFDTLARCFVGGNENDAGEMGELIDGAERIRRELGCTVLLIHHMDKRKATYRGSTALEGAMTTMMELSSRVAGRYLSTTVRHQWCRVYRAFTSNISFSLVPNTADSGSFLPLAVSRSPLSG